MTQLAKRRRNGESQLFPTLKNEFLNGFFSPRLFDFEDELFNSGFASPPANITETDKDFKLDLSVPGMKRDDFRIDVENGILTISSEKEEKMKDEGKNYKHREFSYSSFSRSFTLPDNVDENKIHAKYDNGMLMLNIPKKEVSVSKPKKQISID
jgi:HSP20 family protein